MQRYFVSSGLRNFTPTFVKHLHLRNLKLVSIASMILPTEQCDRPFLFERDTFAFANELIWQYSFDAASGETTTTFRCQPPPTYTHRCFVMVRSARQFFYHARFEPGRPIMEPPAYRKLIHEVVSRSPRRPCRETEKVVIPGYDGLRSFSQGQEPLLKAGCGSPWESYFVRSHWRMVHPVTRRHQERMAQQLTQSILVRRAPIVHLFRFPRITINHGIVLFHSTESDRDIQFDVYDPNIPGHPLQLTYERATRSFSLSRTSYWAGGALNVIEMYIGGLY